MDSLTAQLYYINNNGVEVIEKDNLYYINNEPKDLGDEIISIEEVFFDEDIYVYDLETENNVFQAGVGNIIVHNTDSVFLKYKKSEVDFTDKIKLDKVIKECFEKAKEVSECTTKIFKNPIFLEFEKIYLPLLMFEKKTYVGAMYKTPDKFEMDNKGVVLKRRDNPNLTKIVYQGIIDILFADGEKGIKKSLFYLESEINKLLRHETDIKNLVISKTYKSNYKSDNIPHKILAERMKERDPGSAPNYNDRVPYVFVENKNKYAKQFEKVEDPQYVIDNCLKIDSIYYVEKSLKNPVSQILSTFMSKKDIDLLFERCINDYTLKKNGQRKITDFFGRK